MPTIEVGEFDKVFVVRRQPMELPKNFRQVVDLGENDLVLTVQEGEVHGTDPETGREIRYTPKVKVHINGTQIGHLSKVRFEAHSVDPIPVMEFSVLSPDIEGFDSKEGLEKSLRESLTANLDRLKRLLPLATIHETGLKGAVVQSHGRDLTDTLATNAPE